MNRNKAISLAVGALLLAPLAAAHAAEIATSNSPSADGAAALRIPSLDEVAGEWIPMKDVANPPAVHNFREMLIIGYDLVLL